jgi:hypothetical protein
VVGGLVFLSLSATACSSGSKAAAARPASAAGATGKSTTAAAPAGNAGSVDVCSLMSSAQASTINHVTYGATKLQHLATGIDSCTYTNTGQHASPVDIQNLDVQVMSGAGCYTELQQAEGPGTAVSGVGDAAFGYSIGIIVKDGDKCVEVEGLTIAELQGNYAPDTAMAKIIIAALH